jgi:aminoglycoside phosphotransferase (APT) family kinase protein
VTPEWADHDWPVANAHRRFLDQTELEAVLRAGGIEARLTDYQVLSGGTFNTVYRLGFADGPGLVLKLTPDPAGAAMTYERGILQTEGDFYRLAAERAELPVPAVIATHQLGAEHGGGQTLLVSELPGLPWSESAVPDADRDRLRDRLGELVAALHQVTGPAFGYPSESTGPLTASWNEAFTAMIEAVLADALRYQVRLPVAPDRIRRALADCAAELDGVLVPTLVHFDLWNGNVLVDLAAEGGPRISGIIDGERAMWGDPVVDLVSTALFGEIRDDESFIRGYRRSGAAWPLAAPGADAEAGAENGARRRLLLYRVYLGLIMTVEPVPRGDRPAAEFVERISSRLTADLIELEQLSRS